MPDFLADLNAFRHDLEGSGLLADVAFGAATIQGVIDIDERGSATAIKALSIRDRIREVVPRLPQRTSNPVAAFLTGTADYWFGQRRDLQRKLHQDVLSGVDDEAARAVLAFLAADHGDQEPPVANYALRYKGEFAHRRPALREAWRAYYRHDPDINPRVRVMPSEAFIRLGTRSNFDSGRSYDDDLTFLDAMDPAGAGRAMDWLLDRPSTVRHQNAVVIGWMAGDPFADPTPLVLPFRVPPEDWTAPEPFGTLHVALLRAYPPARMHLRWYWSGDAALAFDRLAAFNRDLRAAVPHYFRAERSVRWHAAFVGLPRWTDMVMAILQAVLAGGPLPRGVMMEVVRLHRKPSTMPNEAVAAALLEVWAISNGHMARQSAGPPNKEIHDV
jgi:hypothetical protein